MNHRTFAFLFAGLLLLPLIANAERSRRGGRDSDDDEGSSKKSTNERYVSVPVAELKEDKTVEAKTVTELKRGEELKIVEPGDGRWLKVALTRDANVAGWIYFNKIVDEKPKDVGEHLAFGGGITTSDMETGNSIRGLKKASQSYAAKKKVTQKAIDDLHRVQTFPLTLKDFDKNANGNLDAVELKAADKARKDWLDKNITAFLKEGKLGEFAP